METLDNTHLRELLEIVSDLNHETIGDSMSRALVLRSAIADPVIYAHAHAVMDTIRGFARAADIGWRIFRDPIVVDARLTEMETWQLMAVVGTLSEFNFAFESVEEASLFTFENSAPVRFYINGIFHYLTALFLLDKKGSKRSNLPYPGTVVKVLHPVGLTRLLDPVFEVFDRQFGEECTYGETVLAFRNKQFVHGSFSPANIRNIVLDSGIFEQPQRLRFMQYHWDLYDRLIILRLQLISILTAENVSLDNFSVAKLYHL